jgi:hypothetical protein
MLKMKSKGDVEHIFIRTKNDGKLEQTIEIPMNAVPVLKGKDNGDEKNADQFYSAEDVSGEK